MIGKTTQRCYLNSPVGWLEIEAEEAGVSAIRFMKSAPNDVPEFTYGHLKDAYRQLREYFRGERLSFSFKLSLRGTPFQETVWRALKTVPFGSTVSYGDIASQIGAPQAARAVGTANNRNPLPIVIPCHRVVGKNGDLTGYAPGLSIKQALLSMEGAKAEALA